LLTDDNIEKVEALSRFAQGRDHTLLELAFGWLLSHRVVASVIAGATSAGQVQQNANAAGWQLTDEERSEASRLVPLAP
jgi:aryl-alcohol dehydrogenase-like predicted oxidoreductase